jgi:hypothetical protein
VPIVHECSAPGCVTLTMGLLCLEHEAVGDEPQQPRRRSVARAAVLGAAAGLAAALLARARIV